MKKSLSIFVLILLFSCQKKESNPNIGNWYFDQIVDYDSTKIKFPKIILENEFAPYYNFEILNDSVLDYKQGFYYTITNKVWNGVRQDSETRVPESCLGNSASRCFRTKEWRPCPQTTNSSVMTRLHPFRDSGHLSLTA